MADESSVGIKLTYKITDIQQIGHTNVHLIGLEITDGKEMWRKAFKVDYGRPISFEEFERDIATKNLLPGEDDPMAYLREEIGKDHEIVLPKTGVESQEVV